MNISLPTGYICLIITRASLDISLQKSLFWKNANFRSRQKFEKFLSPGFGTSVTRCWIKELPKYFQKLPK